MARAMSSSLIQRLSTPAALGTLGASSFCLAAAHIECTICGRGKHASSIVVRLWPDVLINQPIAPTELPRARASVSLYIATLPIHHRSRRSRRSLWCIYHTPAPRSLFKRPQIRVPRLKSITAGWRGTTQVATLVAKRRLVRRRPRDVVHAGLCDPLRLGPANLGGKLRLTRGEGDLLAGDGAEQRLDGGPGGAEEPGRVVDHALAELLRIVHFKVIDDELDRAQVQRRDVEARHVDEQHRPVLARQVQQVCVLHGVERVPLKHVLRAVAARVVRQLDVRHRAPSVVVAGHEALALVQRGQEVRLARDLGHHCAGDAPAPKGQAREQHPHRRVHLPASRLEEPHRQQVGVVVSQEPIELVAQRRSGKLIEHLAQVVGFRRRVSTWRERFRPLFGDGIFSAEQTKQYRPELLERRFLRC